MDKAALLRVPALVIDALSQHPHLIAAAVILLLKDVLEIYAQQAHNVQVLLVQVVIANHKQLLRQLHATLVLLRIKDVILVNAHLVVTV